MYWYILYFLLAVAALLIGLGCTPIHERGTAAQAIEYHRSELSEDAPAKTKPFGCDARDLINFSCE